MEYGLDQTISENLTAYNQASGILCFDCMDPAVVGNNSHHNGDSGFEFKSDASNPQGRTSWLVNNVAWKNAQHGFDFNHILMPVMLSNLAYGNGTDAALNGHGISFENHSPGAVLLDNISVEQADPQGYNLRVDCTSDRNREEILPYDPSTFCSGATEWPDAIFDSDYDMLYTTGGSPASGRVYWRSGAAEEVVYVYVEDGDSTPDSFREDTTNEGNGVRSAPLFVDPDNGDFRVLGTSEIADWAYQQDLYDAIGIRAYDEPAKDNKGTGIPPGYRDKGPFESINWSFETNTSGWAGYNGGTIATTTSCGGSCKYGSKALEVTGPSSTSSFGVNDSGDWVIKAVGNGLSYRFSAYVRSASHTGVAKIRVREYDNPTGTQQGVTTYSAGVTLSPSWQLVTVDYKPVGNDSHLDLQILNHIPNTTNEVFQVDGVNIERVWP